MTQEADEARNLPATRDQDLIDDAKRISELGPFKVLLNRSFKALGDYAGEQVERWVQERKIKREKNLKDHLEAVPGASEVKSRTIKQEQLTFEWAEAAQDVGDEDPELAAFWRGALQAIETNSHFAEDATRALKEMSSADAHTLITLSHWHARMRHLMLGPRAAYKLGGSSATRDKLVRLGLLAKWYEGLPINLVGAIGGSSLSVLLVWAVEPHFLFQSNVQFARFLAMVAAMLFASLIALWVTAPNLTPLGQYVVEQGKRFMKRSTSC